MSRANYPQPTNSGKTERFSPRVRYAPSPTGDPHIGNMRTALFNWLFARRYGGKFILRIEDTDQTRLKPDSLEKIFVSLEWLGLDWDEGPNFKSEIRNPKTCPERREGSETKNVKEIIQNSKNKYGPYIQSERLNIYQKYAQELLENGKAYKCFCRPERLEKMRKEQIAKGQAPMYDGRCRSLVSLRGGLTSSEALNRVKGEADEAILFNNKQKFENYVIRLKVPREGETEFEDLIRGKISFANKLIDDQVLLKSDGWPTYHLASVVDDYLMKITHVIRGEEWLSSVPKHIFLYQAFGWSMPKFAHLPIILGPDKSKLSKRHGTLSILEYQKQGYLPGTLINFMALLGWNPGKDTKIKGEREQEIFNQQELIKKFSLDRVQKGGAIFNLEKLDWMNGYYIRQMDLKELTKKCMVYLRDVKYQISNLKCQKIVALEQERMRKLSEITELTKFFFVEKLDYDPELLRWKEMKNDEIVKNLELTKKELTKIKEKDFKKEKLKKVLMELTKKTGKGELLWPFRVALTGRQASPGPFEVAEILGKKRAIARVEEAEKQIISGR